MAGGTGERQALPEAVHSVEPDGQFSFRHGFQGLGGSKGKFGLIGQARLGTLSVPGTSSLDGRERETEREIHVDMETVVYIP